MSTMIEVKTAELSGYALDWAVGVACKDSEPRLYQDIRGFWLIGPFGKPWNPSVDWSQGGPLIEKFGIEFKRVPLQPPIYSMLAGLNTGVDWALGETHLVAACRAIVGMQMGVTVQVPEELIP